MEVREGGREGGLVGREREGHHHGSSAEEEAGEERAGRVAMHQCMRDLCCCRCYGD